MIRIGMYKIFISIILWPIWFLFLGITVFIFFILLVIIPRQHLHYIVRPICWLYCFIAGQWLIKENQIPDINGQPYIYMFNHESMFDQFMIAAFIPHYLTAVAAIEQFRYPIWGVLMRQYGIIPIIRQELGQAMSSLNMAENALRDGISFIIAPEGTRSLDGELNSFKKGPFHVAKNTGATIVPIALIGSYKAKKKTDWRIAPGKLITRFGVPIREEDYSKMTIDEMRDYVYKKIYELKKT